MESKSSKSFDSAGSGRVARGDRLSIFQVMPRDMYFGPSRATSIDLCAQDLISASRFRDTTKIFAEECDEPFPGFSIEKLPHVVSAVTAARTDHIVRAARQERPDVIIVQQHLPTAAAIARRLPQAKVILHRHNFHKSFRPRSPLREFFSRFVNRRRYSRLAGLIYVSQACADAFALAWPDISAPSCVVNNGLDFDAWHPEAERSNEVLCVARCAPEKGVLEAAQAVAAVLPAFPRWRARFILSNIADYPGYAQDVQAALSGLGAQGLLEVQRPFSEVKAANERAAIALVPSRWLEPFGRTALEAHAGGAALVSSGSGGLAEVSGESALMLPAVTTEAIAAGVETLITDVALRERLAREAMSRVRYHFDIKVQAARMDAFCCAISAGAQTTAVGVSQRLAVPSPDAGGAGIDTNLCSGWMCRVGHR